MYEVKFPTFRKSVPVAAGTTILAAAAMAGLEATADCGGKGTCGKCKVIVEGSLEPLTDTERRSLADVEIKRGIRLACQARVNGDASVEFVAAATSTDITPFRMNFIADGLSFFGKRSLIRKFIAPPTLSSFIDPIYGSATHTKADFISTTKQDAEICSLITDTNTPVEVLVDGNELCDISLSSQNDKLYGVAIDVGTTTLNVRLVDIDKGEIKGSVVSANPQRLFGADIASRINYAADNKSGIEIMRERVVSRINAMIDKLANDNGIPIAGIKRAALVGNPTMAHILLGIDPSAIAASPYVSAFRSGIKLSAEEVGLKLGKGARVELIPSVAGYVGADAVAAAMRVRLFQPGKPRLMIDLGTNAEIMLSDGDKLWCCAAAAGPALEGAHIKCGMSAVDGAVDHIDFDPGLEWTTIGGVAPTGLCGTGLLDSIAGLLDIGIIESNGRMVVPNNIVIDGEVRRRLIINDTDARFIIVNSGEGKAEKDIYITPQDIREVQLAIGAIRAGVEILLERAKIDASDLERIYLAGSLGSYLRVETAVRVGLTPNIDKEKIVFVGNAALDGAVEVLVSADRRDEAISTTSSINYVELSSEHDFQNRFAENLKYPAF